MVLSLTRSERGVSVTFPPEVAEALHLEGDQVRLEAYGEGFRFRSAESRPSPTLDEMLARIRPEHLHGETDWGRDVEAEEWTYEEPRAGA